MIRRLVKGWRRQILVDINTQKDFLLAAGKVCIRNHKRVLAHIRRMLAWARHNHIPIISVSEVHPENNGANYCIDGTEGQKKIRYSLLNNRISFPADGMANLPSDIIKHYRQVIVHKRCMDPFDEPRIERLLSEVRANEFILIGATTEGAVEATALGLLQRGRKVTVVTDAVGTRDSREAEMAMRKMMAKGARLVETRKIAGTSHLHQVGVCDCKRCTGQIRRKQIEIQAS